MPKVEWTENGATIELVCDAIIRISSPDVTRLDQEVSNLARGVDFLSASLETRAPIDGHPAYTYEIIHRDLRKLTLTVIADDFANPLIRFEPSDDWRQSELKQQRGLQDLLFIFLVTFKLTKFEAIRP